MNDNAQTGLEMKDGMQMEATSDKWQHLPIAYKSHYMPRTLFGHELTGKLAQWNIKWLQSMQRVKISTLDMEFWVHLDAM